MKFGEWANETKSGLRQINIARIVIILILTCSILLLIPLTASAWKPKHHIHTGNEAISEILGGQDVVTINGEQYSVSSEVAQAIRNYPAYYRAGCMGPDGFPDFVYGQMLIHPDNHDSGGTYTYDWLEHVFNSGWSYYNSHPGTEGQQALAFTYGYLTHAAGDMWGHTLINSFAGGAWPDDPVADSDIIIRHLIVEEYIARRTPTTTLSINIPSDFIYYTFINNDTAHSLAITHWISEYFGIPFFVELRQALVEERNGIDCDWWQPWDWLDCGKREYLDAWIDDIDSGLRAWPNYMGQISKEFFLNDYDGHFEAGMQIFENFAYRHLLSMYGSPDFVGDFLENWDDLTEWIEGLIDIDIPSFSDLVIYLIEWTFGFSFDELKDYVTELANYINVPPLFEPDTSDRLDALMYVAGEGDEVYFDPQQFAANWNTILVAKMVLLNPDALNQILFDYDVGPLYGGANNLVPVGMWENAMLGFIRSLDGNHQWRKVTIDDPSIQHSEGTPLWIDCQAREHVFRVLFTDWENNNFPDYEDDCECWNDLPPVITVDLNRFVLWPPNHKMVDIVATVAVEDACDENPTFVLTSITTNEPDEGLGDGDHPFDIQGASYGTSDTEFQLRAERSGIGEGRTYSITYTASDYAGNTTDALVTVRVPHDNQGRAIASNGFNISGMGFDPQHETFVLIIPTIPETAETPVENSFIATSVDEENAYVGNTCGAIRPVKSWLYDFDADGFEDLALLYSVTSVVDILLNSDEIDGPIALHFHTVDEIDYLVPDIFGLGAPIVIDLPVTAAGDPLEDSPDYALPELTSVKAYPNPFNPYTTVTFNLATDNFVNLAIYDAKGALVRSLVTGFHSAGGYQLTWNGRDNEGRSVGSGVYLLRFLAGDYTEIQKLIMLK